MVSSVRDNRLGDLGCLYNGVGGLRCFKGLGGL